MSTPAPSPVSIWLCLSAESFAGVLVIARTRAGLSQSRLAEHAECDHSMISRYERSARHPTRDAITRLVAAMDLSASEDGRQLAVRLYVSAGFVPSGWKITGLEWVGEEGEAA